MLDVDGALAIARAAIESAEQPDVVGAPFAPVVTDLSVMVFYNRRAYFSGDVVGGLAGNGPAVVDRRDGTVRWLGSHDDPEVLLAELEAHLRVGRADAPPPM